MPARPCLVLISIWASAAFVPAAASALTLVKDGKSVSLIVMADDPYPSQEKAASELQYHLKRMTGAAVPIIRERELGSTEATMVLVGQSERLRSLGVDTTKLAPETMVVRTLGNTLVLAGEDGGSKVRNGSYADRSISSSAQHNSQAGHTMAILNHPENFDGKCVWFTRDYGHLSPSPFSFRKEPWQYAKGQVLCLRYRVVLHAGDPREAGLNTIYEQWVRETATEGTAT